MAIFLIFIFGLALGSFLNVLIDRLPNGESIWWGRSHCDHCKKTLRWYELIPILSWIIQGGKCRRCRKSLSIQYPLIELITAVILVYIYLQTPNPPIVLSSYLIVLSLLVIFLADLKYQIIPDSMIITGVVGTLLLIFTMNYELSTMNLLLSALSASAFFFLLWLITRGRGMGFGDVKLAFLMGLFLGFPKIIIALYAAFLTGALVGVILILAQNKSLKTKIAFGPFLIWGTLVAWFWGERIVAIWKGLI